MGGGQKYAGMANGTWVGGLSFVEYQNYFFHFHTLLGMMFISFVYHYGVDENVLWDMIFLV